MNTLVWIGLALALAGLGGLGWCVLQALKLRRSQAEAEEIKRTMNRLVAANGASVGTAFFGLALMLLGAML
ncbi:MAG: hypothetical protein AAGI34_04890 [Pseudomonadota bacterium]